MKSVIAWFAGNHVATNLLMLFFIFAGIYTGVTMKIEVFPETDLDKVSVTVVYPGASPSEVEESIVRKVEERVAGLDGVKRVDSVSREGFGSVTIEIMSGWDLKKLLDDVKSEVDGITTFPGEAEQAIVREVTRRTQVINVALYGDVSESTLKNLAEKVKDELTELPQVSQAEFFGKREGEIHIEVSEDTLRRYGLTLGQVASAVRRASLDLPAGSIDTTGGEVLVRTKGRRYNASDYRDVAVLTRPDGSKVTLEQIADLKDDFEDNDLGFLFNGQPAIGVQIFRVGDQNAITVAGAVKDYMERIRPTLPAGVRIDYFQDMSKILKDRISLLLRNMAMGLVLVVIVLGLFLSVRLSFWVTLGIPISFLFGLMFLPRFDVSINMVSLFAFIMVLGIVVDDAIVIGENIYRKQEEGQPPLQAAIGGAIEVGLPVIFSVLTTMVAFWPLLLAGGAMGKIMWNLPVVVIAVLAGSLVESLFILPSHLAGSKNRALRLKRYEEKEKWASRHLKRFVEGPYARFVEFCVSYRYATLAAGIAVLLLIGGTFTSGLLKFTLFPKVESDVLTCGVTMPSGTPVERTREVMTRLNDSVQAALAELDEKRPEGAPPLYKLSATLLGTQMTSGPAGSTEIGGHLAQIWVEALEGEKRDTSAAEMIKAWREKMGPVPDAESLTYQSDLFRAGNPVEIHLSMDDTVQLAEAADELKEELTSYPGVFDVNDSFQPGKMEIQMKLEPTARSLGLALEELALQVRHAFYGAEALRFLRGQDEVKVLVRYPESERKSLADIEEMRIRTVDGFEVPFRQVARVNMERGYSTIERAQRKRVIKVTADVDEAVTNANEVRQKLERDILPKMLGKYRGLTYTAEGEGREQKESLQDVLKGFLLALFLIYALLAVPFKSFSQPFIVMTAIPFGIAGALIGHLLMGFNLSLVSLFGIVGLAGVVVNDSLVLIDAANRLRADGQEPFEAVTRAGRLRFRAILLTSATTFAGLTPMLLERSLQAQFLIPMAISLGFGVAFSTGVTLCLVPCGYMILEDIHDFIGNIKGWVRSRIDPAHPGR